MVIALAMWGCASNTAPLPAGGEAVDLQTRDGVDLVADVYPAASGSPAVLLLHMRPSAENNRSNWPGDFLQSLVDQGHTVMALDRRGAGDSGGIDTEAFEGPNGKFDVEAAVNHLDGLSTGSLAIIGASNGTTSMIDYAVWAPGEGLTEPAVLGFMSGGSYTETQNPMSAVPLVPAIFTYPPEEVAWADEQRALDPGTWEFLEYEGGEHGTRMFEAVPEVSDDLVEFLTRTLP